MMLGFTLFLYGTLFSAVSSVIEGTNKLKDVFEWPEVCYDYPSSADEESDIAKHILIPGTPYMADIDVHYPEPIPYGQSDTRRTIFVATPRYAPGTPATLSIVSQKQFNKMYRLTPYPSWTWNRNPEKCGTHRLVSVERIRVDKCHRLWVLDTGKINGSIVCAPQILTFDLRTNELIQKFEIPETQCTSQSYLSEIIVDYRGSCNDNPFVYVADANLGAIIVVDIKRHLSWKVEHESMHPDPDCAKVSVNGVSFKMLVGIQGMAIHNGKLFYHSFSSYSESSVPLEYLRNHSNFETPNCLPGLLKPSDEEVFHTFRRQRRSQGSVEAMDKHGVMYFGLVGNCSLACYNTIGDYGDSRHSDLLLTDEVRLDYISTLKIHENPYENCEELWVLSNRFQKLATCGLNPNEINFRILVGKVEHLTAGKRCSIEDVF